MYIYDIYLNIYIYNIYIIIYLIFTVCIYIIKYIHNIQMYPQAAWFAAAVNDNVEAGLGWGVVFWGGGGVQ